MIRRYFQEDNDLRVLRGSEAGDDGNSDDGETHSDFW